MLANASAAELIIKLEDLTMLPPQDECCFLHAPDYAGTGRVTTSRYLWPKHHSWITVQYFLSLASCTLCTIRRSLTSP